MDATPRRSLARALPLLALVALGWVLPAPEGLEPDAWRLTAVFAAVIAGFLLQPFPMGVTVLLGLLACSATGVLHGPGGEASAGSMGAAMAGYGEEVVWLVVGAFLLAGALEATGLGRRIALLLVVRLGRSTLGLGYAQACAELLLGPVVPSNTARGGGILAPISASLSRALDSHPGEGAERAGRYLTLVGAHANLVTAAMFLTGMAANPILSDAARGAYGLDFDWGTWALAMVVPGLVALAGLPLLLRALAPPTVSDGRPAQERARRDLASMGPASREERLAAAVFTGLVLLWATKFAHGMGTTLVAWTGVAALLLGRALSWSDVVRNARAWDTLVWLGGVLTLANGLREQGVMAWFADHAGAWVGDAGALATALLLVLVYAYSMYGFSMLTAHISAMAPAFLGVCAVAGVPALVAVPLFAAFSNLCACTTNYSTGPVILYFGLGYVPTRTWFRVGFVVSLYHLAVWIPLGLGWWKLLGWW